MGVVMRHYNKAGFYFKCIECDDEFKSVMHEVCDEMGIETNYTNSDDQVTEAKSNNRVIKDMFQIAYYQFTYKNIPRIMIRHLATNATQNLNF